MGGARAEAAERGWSTPGARKTPVPPARSNDERQAAQAGLDLLRVLGWLVLHDVAVKGDAEAVADHVVVGPSGVFVVNNAPWPGAVTFRDGRMLVSGVPHSDEVDQVAHVADGVRALLGDCPVAAVLCLVHGESVTGVAGEVAVCSTENMLDLLTQLPAVLDPATQQHVSRVVGAALAPAGPRTAVPVVESSAPSAKHRSRPRLLRRRPAEAADVEPDVEPDLESEVEPDLEPNLESEVVPEIPPPPSPVVEAPAAEEPPVVQVSVRAPAAPDADERVRAAEELARAAEERERATAERERAAAEHERRITEERERIAADRERLVAEARELQQARAVQQAQELERAQEQGRQAAADRERRAAQERERRAAQERERRAAQERERVAAERARVAEDRRQAERAQAEAVAERKRAIEERRLADEARVRSEREARRAAREREQAEKAAAKRVAVDRAAAVRIEAARQAEAAVTARAVPPGESPYARPAVSTPVAQQVAAPGEAPAPKTSGPRSRGTLLPALISAAVVVLLISVLPRTAELVAWGKGLFGEQASAFGTTVSVEANTLHPALRVTAGTPTATQPTKGAVARGTRLVAVPLTLRNDGAGRWATQLGARVVAVDSLGVEHTPARAGRVKAGKQLPGSFAVAGQGQVSGVVVFSVPSTRTVTGLRLQLSGERDDAVSWGTWD